MTRMKLPLSIPTTDNRGEVLPLCDAAMNNGSEFPPRLPSSNPPVTDYCMPLLTPTPEAGRAWTCFACGRVGEFDKTYYWNIGAGTSA